MLLLPDLSAAFDTVDHEILLKILNSIFSICGTALNWFRSYLTNRTQVVLITVSWAQVWLKAPSLGPSSTYFTLLHLPTFYDSMTWNFISTLMTLSYTFLFLLATI